RKRQFAPLVKIDRAIKVDNSHPVGADLTHDTRQAVHGGGRSAAHLASRFDQTPPTVLANPFEEKKLDTMIVGKDAGGNDACIVENHQIAIRDEGGEFRKHTMLDPRIAAMEHHHPSIFTTGQRMTRNQRLRERISVITSEEAHI